MNTQEREDKNGVGLAAQIGIAPRRLEYIEARGFLCHELLLLLGGYIEFVPTSWREFVLKVMEAISLPISPICMWLPPQGCVLECVGLHSQCDTRVYRFTPNEGAVVVFFVRYEPERPAYGPYVRPEFNVPQLDYQMFLRPPFDASNNDQKLILNFRHGVLRDGPAARSSPPLLTPEARGGEVDRWMAMCRGIWRGFTLLK